MSAVMKIYCATGATPTYATVDSGDAASFKTGRDDLVTSASTAPVPIPNPGPGTKFSWLKWLVLYCASGGGSTSILNRKINGVALPTGIKRWFIAQASYTQNTGTSGTLVGQFPADSSSDAQTPANQNSVAFTSMPTTATSYDSSTVAATNTTANGKFIMLTDGVDSTCVSGAGAISTGNLTITYDEQAITDVFRGDTLDSVGAASERLQARRIGHLPLRWRRGGSLR